MASHMQGYDEDRFVTKINQNFFCLICFNVLRDPVLCSQNQHCFCRSCIAKHLETNQRCPTCADHLTVETLVEPTRMVKDYLNESNIRCVYIERGCQEILQLQRLNDHEATCGFTPVVCANEGCGVIVSRRDLLHHESEVCEFRKLKCHSCEETRKTLIEIEKRMTKMEAKMEKNKAELKQELRAEMASLKTDLEQTMEQDTAELQAGMANSKTAMEGRFQALNKEVGGLKAALLECFDDMKDVLVKVDANKKKEIIKEVRSRPSGGRESILVAGGYKSSSVEMFNWRQQLWSPVQSMPEDRCGATSFVYNNHATIAGGYGAAFKAVDTMIRMNVEASPDLSTHWSEYPVKLPAKLVHHSSVVYNDQLIVTGGLNGVTSDCIYEIQLSHPYTSKILSKMPEPRQRHSSAIFYGNLLIVGGCTSGSYKDSVNSVLLFDVKKNECKHLAPLPYEVSSFATVKYGDHIVVIGGRDKHDNDLNKVVMYNVVTGQRHMLPPMNFGRSGSAAVVIGNNIVVLGGWRPGGASKSVEFFSFDSYTWSDLPEMSEERWLPTAAVV